MKIFSYKLHVAHNTHDWLSFKMQSKCNGTLTKKYKKSWPINHDFKHERNRRVCVCTICMFHGNLCALNSHKETRKWASLKNIKIKFWKTPSQDESYTTTNIDFLLPSFWNCTLCVPANTMVVKISSIHPSAHTHTHINC